MGCSSSARSRPPDPPTAAGPPPRASSGENTPTADDHETIADQTQLDPVEDVSLASEEANPGKHLPGEEAAAVILAVEGKIDSVSKREEPEGTEPLPAGVEESSELPSAWREESNGPSPPAPGEDVSSPPAPGEDAGSPSPGPAEDSGLVEGSDSSVVEIIKKVHITEEDHLIEGNICAFINSGDQILPPGTCVWVLLTLLRASHELLESEFGPESLYNVGRRRMWLGKPQTHKSKL
ncbi:PREDICTED: glutamate-rich protein 5 isoform X1 [Calidris pugnax]|uniref:glutamate-rich protein 5 isoform X1 n=1 Tax=Calidris pugnax TaxID=198806 RepID=UPI00071E210C|nr:PREDICTED: glutamate-rich protein 5 isoform X1 [Calidris pugnax]